MKSPWPSLDTQPHLVSSSSSRPFVQTSLPQFDRGTASTSGSILNSFPEITRDLWPELPESPAHRQLSLDQAVRQLERSRRISGEQRGDY
jgi:hypothetical protein